MIEGRKLAIYAFLTEIGACEAKLMVFEDKPQPNYHELQFVLEAALPWAVAGLIQNMLAFMDCRDKRYFIEQAIIVAAYEYMRFPWVDNTFKERFIELMTCRPVPYGETDLPF